MPRSLVRLLPIVVLLLSAVRVDAQEPASEVTGTAAAVSAPADAAAAVEPAAAAPAPVEPAAAPVEPAKPAAKVADRIDAKLSGYIQGRYSVVTNTDFNQDDQNGFGLGDARLEGRAKIRTVQGDMFVRLQGDFSGGGGFSLKDGYAGWTPWPALTLTVGQFKVPFAYAVLHSTRAMQLPDAQLAARLGWGRDLGLMISGNPELAKIDGRPFIVHYAVGAFNGEGDNQFRNTNDRNLYAGRLLVQPMGKIGSDESDLSPCLAAGGDDCDPDAARPLRVGIGASLGHDPYSARGKNFDLNREETRWAVDAHAKWRGLSLHAEYVSADLPKTANDVAFSRESWYVQAGYNPGWFHRLEPVVRYEYRDYDTERDNTGPGAAPDQVEFQSRTRTTVGLNAFLTGYDGRLMLAYVMTDLEEGLMQSPQGDPLYGDMVILQAQFGF
jgi:hypothetical protein